MPMEKIKVLDDMSVQSNVTVSVLIGNWHANIHYFSYFLCPHAFNSKHLPMIHVLSIPAATRGESPSFLCKLTPR
jgi:hypothetical protein